ncbi:serine hydrolase domain-containing protein [Alkalimonas amylolytica]|uniref:CubicO group peptidase, beta-lactamase class C family n=1 Tax=Alkalimonas amylolytica TaxID=152573 RepID=A0A1H4ELW1_ALKAM|nr:serine hydrolase domain-containing protein [Alkalimonas amylolytica]SEA85530.1 CubicO group peptidase, beta-lactamase class C family [Alkalimonas amylolytica]
MRFFTLTVALLLTACSSVSPTKQVARQLHQVPEHTELSILWLSDSTSQRIGLRYQQGQWQRQHNQHALFGTGSMTKLFTAHWFALRFVDGSLEPEQPLGSLLPELCPALAQLELGALLTHSAGLPFLPDDIGDMPLIDSNPFADYDALRLQQHCPADSAIQQRQSRYRYSNLGYAYLALAMQAMTGLDYEALLQAAILQPMGLQDSSTEQPTERVAGQNPDGSITPDWDFAAFTGSGGLYSSSHELGIWLAQQLTTDHPAIRNMQHAHHPTAGLGWQKRRAGSRRWLEQTGATGGYTAAMLLDPDQQQAILILSNLSGLHPSAAAIAELAEYWLLQHPFMPDVDAAKD